MLRVSEDGNDIETSRGARVPIQVAQRLFQRWITGTLTMGERVGVYRFNTADNESITVGCHVISYAEARLLAESQGWIASELAKAS